MALLLAPLAARRAHGQTLDRVVASVGNQAITTSEVSREYRFERFLNGKLPEGNPSGATFRKALDRLVAQTLLAQGLVHSATPAERESAQATLGKIRKEYGGRAKFQKALRLLGLSERQALWRIEARVEILDSIERRFGAAAAPTSAQIAEYYQKRFLPEVASRHHGEAPPLAQVRDQIRAVLRERNINFRLAAWLNQQSADRRVRMYGETAANEARR